ncbi:MAG TPA: zinc ribbon domain-containing protein [Myxococcota bacterium]|jgi:putative FmdB family regulatory protein|nr:zinc ribbon domain-containing protein [Myxococcota bacterium]
MPTYEYRCDKCGHEFEREQRITEDPIKKCPSCGALKAKRMISATSFVLKGGGWYSDLYSSGGAKKKGEAGGSGTGSSGASESSSSAGSGAGSSSDSGSGGSGSKPKGSGSKADAAA